MTAFSLFNIRNIQIRPFVMLMLLMGTSSPQLQVLRVVQRPNQPRHINRTERSFQKPKFKSVSHFISLSLSICRSLESNEMTCLCLQVCKILHAESHPKADKLLVCKVQVDSAQPQPNVITICAGIKKYDK
jgi:tRNA-binding EMAP/Myf-like protein